MIDWKQVMKLRDDLGPDGFEEVVAIFLEEVDEAVARLRGTTSRADLGHELHFLKGSALNLGFADFAALCATGEAQCKAGTPDAVAIPALLACFNASRAMFVADLDSHTSD